MNAEILKIDNDVVYLRITQQGVDLQPFAHAFMEHPASIPCQETLCVVESRADPDGSWMAGLRIKDPAALQLVQAGQATIVPTVEGGLVRFAVQNIEKAVTLQPGACDFCRESAAVGKRPPYHDNCKCVKKCSNIQKQHTGDQKMGDIVVSNTLYNLLKMYSTARINKSAPNANPVDAISRAVNETEFGKTLYKNYNLAGQLESCQIQYGHHPQFFAKILKDATSNEPGEGQTKTTPEELRAWISTELGKVGITLDTPTLDAITSMLFELTGLKNNSNSNTQTEQANGIRYANSISYPSDQTQKSASPADEIDRLARELVQKSAKPMDLAVARNEIRQRYPSLARQENQTYRRSMGTLR